MEKGSFSTRCSVSFVSLSYRSIFVLCFVVALVVAACALTWWKKFSFSKLVAIILCRWLKYFESVIFFNMHFISDSTISAALIEITRYVEDGFLNRKEDPLLWWKKNSCYYPLMSTLVRRNSNTMGTSVPCERLFSKAGNLVTERRSRLKTKNVEKLLFLNANTFLL